MHNIRLWLPALGVLAAYWIMLRYRGRMAWAVAALLGGTSLVFGWMTLIRATGGHQAETFLFAVFAGLAILSAFCMIVQRNPVYAALCFAMTVLNGCGLYFLQSAPFLAAATIIVYAGAVIVTFLFVIMLAQQSGLAEYDRRPSKPLFAAICGAIILGGLLFALERPIVKMEWPTRLQTSRSNLSVPSEEQFGTVLSLGRSLFGDYLWTVEIAGAILTATTVGAIVIASGRKGAIT